MMLGPNNSRQCPMFNLASLIIGFVALICALVAFLPLLGWMNWLIIPLAIIGAGVGMISRGTAGRIQSASSWLLPSLATVAKAG